MKKVILAVAVIATVSLTSCFKKDRVCTCTDTTVTTTTTTLPGQTPKTETETESGTYMVTFTKARKGDAKTACISQKYTNSGNQGTYVSYTQETTLDCSVK
jgi:hypothetical protein